MHSDYRQLLREELERRFQRNSNYSQRSFARDIGLTSPRLSSVLSGRSGLSRAVAAQIAQKLGYNSEDSAQFCDLVESQHARSKFQKSLALRRLEKVRPNSKYIQLQTDVFNVVSDWYYFAALELTAIKKFRGEPAWIAHALSITVPDAERAIESLTRLGLLGIKKGRWSILGAFSTTMDIPSEAIRKFYHQVLKKAQRALDQHPVAERDFSSLTLAFDSRRLPEAKAMLERHRREFDREFGLEGKKDQVYCLSMQFFSLTPALDEIQE